MRWGGISICFDFKGLHQTKVPLLFGFICFALLEMNVLGDLTSGFAEDFGYVGAKTMIRSGFSVVRRMAMR